MQIPARMRQLVAEFLATTAAVGGVQIYLDGVEESGFRDDFGRGKGVA